MVMSFSHAVCAACYYLNLHHPKPTPAPFPDDTIFAGLPLDVANRRQNVSMVVFMAMLSGHFHNQRPCLPDNPRCLGVYAASANRIFPNLVRLNRTL
jgi:hypothetical protein